MENPIGKNKEFMDAGDLEGAMKVVAARNEILRLRDASRKALAAGKNQTEKGYGFLQFAKDFEGIDLSMVNDEEAALLDAVMHAAGMEAYEEFVETAHRYHRENIESLSEESPERKSREALYNYIANRGIDILGRGQQK